MEKKRKKRPPDNRHRCCVGSCNRNTTIFYLKNYPICDKHWDLDCDHKFKYKHFRTLREYLGFPPIPKPKGYEHIKGEEEDCLAYHAEIQIDVETNVPVVMSEELTLWQPESPPKQPQQTDVKWNGKKEDPLELYITIKDTNIVLLRAMGIAVKFSSEKAIKAAMGKLQNLLDTGLTTLPLRMQKAFKKSKFWKINENCQEQIEAANGN
jgi:hypothetical protein